MDLYSNFQLRLTPQSTLQLCHINLLLEVLSELEVKKFTHTRVGGIRSWVSCPKTVVGNQTADAVIWDQPALLTEPLSPQTFVYHRTVYLCDCIICLICFVFFLSGLFWNDHLYSVLATKCCLHCSPSQSMLSDFGAFHIGFSWGCHCQH